ncbi:MAG: helical backbone metal receptor [Pseudomonadaceae bacterium]|nr:helical backbone metal receptor [Pseudomonadaceae bacterium]
MPGSTDQMGRAVNLQSLPRRIVSLVPSQTELLFELGVENRVVGVTRYCEFPARARRHKSLVGGTKQINVDVVAALKPDLIIGNKEENSKDDIDALSERYPVWMSDIETVDDALDMIEQVGALVGRGAVAADMAARIGASLDTMTETYDESPPSVAYFIWRKPFMVVGRRTFIDDLLKRAGFSNAFDRLERYPEVTPVELADAEPQVVFLSSEPFPFEQKHVDEMRRMLPSAHVRIVDGTLFSWYGSRLALSADYLSELLTATKAALRT